ncbi:MAG: HdeD family acid-resistance protein [Hyphomicrobiales bacterium]|nr:MAG: HdeD family acid-resistance protein [Hyphomicrobiales bacterium]
MTDQKDMIPQDYAAAVAEARRQISEHWGWFLGLGIVFVLAGLASIAFPLVTTIAAKVALGWIFLVSGVLALIHSFSITRWGALLLNLLIGALYVLAGAYLAFFPLTGILTLTLLLAALFIAEGVMQVVMGARLRGHEGWIWLIISGLIAIAAGAMIAMDLPSSAGWAIGLLVGINFLSTGLSFVFLSLAGRKAKGGGTTA